MVVFHVQTREKSAQKISMEWFEKKDAGVEGMG
jgi:hypothetical protein